MMMPINRLCTATAILGLFFTVFQDAPEGYPGLGGLFRLVSHLCFFLYVSWRLIVAVQAEEAQFQVEEKE